MKKELVALSLLVPLFAACGDSSSSSASAGDGSGAGDARADTTRLEIDVADVGTAADVDTAWDAGKANRIVLKGSSIETEGTGTTVSGTTCTVTKAGDYEVTGSLDESTIDLVDGKGSFTIPAKTWKTAYFGEIIAVNIKYSFLYFFRILHQIFNITAVFAISVIKKLVYFIVYVLFMR